MMKRVNARNKLASGGLKVAPKEMPDFMTRAALMPV